MAKAFVVFERKKEKKLSTQLLKEICTNGLPAEWKLREPTVYTSDYLSYVIVNPTPDLTINLNSFFLGKLVSPGHKWGTPGERVPDGSYALFRLSEQQIEILSDIIASRTVWYYFDEERFIASSSQRTIIRYLGNFEFNQQVISWMLSSGNLGPNISWDKRIKLLPANSILKVDILSWTINLRTFSNFLSPIKRKDKEHEKQLRESLKQAIEPLVLDLKYWALLLSQSLDSQILLRYLENYNNTFQYLRKVSKYPKSEDNEQPQKIIDSTKTNNVTDTSSSFSTIKSEKAINILLDTFIELNEGRTDRLDIFLTYQERWKELAKMGYNGIIRGDESFKHPPVHSRKEVRALTGLQLCDDFENLQDYQSLGLQKQVLPVGLLQGDEETLEQWRDRLYHSHFIPVASAATTEMKALFLEVINPLATREVIQTFRQLPDHLRTNKLALKAIVNSFPEDARLTEKFEKKDLASFASDLNIRNILKKQLLSKAALELFPEDFLKKVVSEIDGVPAVDASHNDEETVISKKSVLRKMERALKGHKIKSILHSSTAPSKLDPILLGLRVYIICKSYVLLKEDASGRNYQK